MKRDYLDNLKAQLDRYAMDDLEKQDIINDYDDMYENWKDCGMTETEVEDKLGKPNKIIGSLTEGYPRVKHIPSKDNKIIAVTPFIATIAFFIIGLGFDGWAWGWMVYLLIPTTAIITEMGKGKGREHITTALSPFIAVITFFILGFFYGLWHPGWAVFLIIPILGIFNSRDSMDDSTLLVSLSPFISLLAFLYLGFFQGLWNPGWLVFLFIPIVAMFEDDNKGRIFFNELFLIGGIAGYLAIGYYTDFGWLIAGLSFIPFVLYNIYNGNITVSLNENANKEYVYVLVFIVIAYAVVSFATGWWAITWLIFLIMPVFAIQKETKGSERLIATTPFIALTIFMCLGFFFGAWAWAWLAFLIIPVTAIITET